MRKLGLIGGMSWVSTRTYYDVINREVQRHRGGIASAPMLIESLDFAELHAIREEDDWNRAASILGDSAKRLEDAGAGAIVMATNAMHKVYEAIADRVQIEIIHIADSVGERMAADGRKGGAILGSRNVMAESWYRERLRAHGIQLMVPKMRNVDTLDRIIYQELVLGKVTRDSQRELKSIITTKEQEGAEAIVLACTELELIVDIDANVLPIYDSARCHCASAIDWLLGAD